MATPMSIAQRLLQLAGQITRNSEQERIQRENITRDRHACDQALRDRNVLHEVDEANRELHRKVGALQRENDELRKKLAQLESQAVSCLRQVADRSEAWRRTMEHFRLTWGPMLPQVASDISSVCDVSDLKIDEVSCDLAWQQVRDTFIRDQLKPVLPA